MAEADDRRLSELAEALQDHSPEHSWWIDPGTGELELWSEFLADELGEGHPDERGAPDRAEGERAIADAEGFVDAIGAWLIGRRS